MCPKFDFNSQMELGMTGHPGQHAVSVVTEELNQELVPATFRLIQMGGCTVKDLAMKMLSVTPSSAREVSCISKHSLLYKFIVNNNMHRSSL